MTDVLSTTHGRHTFKTGFDVNLIHEVMINLFHGGGVYAYNGAAQTRSATGWPTSPESTWATA